MNIRPTHLPATQPANSLSIRAETQADHAVISEVTEAAFRTLAISNHTEQFIVTALRAAGALSLSLVAEEEGCLVGHIAFSPVTISDASPHWYGLGPISVLPEYQQQGIGTALMREGLSQMKAMHAAGICLAGHPEFYRKFGFANAPALTLEGVPPEYFFALSFTSQVPEGRVTFHEAFAATS